MWTERNLLFAVVALKNKLLDLMQFHSACRAWAKDKSKPLADLLVECRWLTVTHREFVAELVKRESAKHKQLKQGRSVLHAVMDFEIRQCLLSLKDPDIEAVLGAADTSPPSFEKTDSPEPIPASPPQNGSPKNGSPAKDRYRRIKKIGSGGMGIVWSATDTEIGRVIAFKELDAEKGKSPSKVKRLLEEAQITGQLEHPGIVPVYDRGWQGEDTPFYAMKLVQGVNLKVAIENMHKLRRGDPKPLSSIARWRREWISLMRLKKLTLPFLWMLQRGWRRIFSWRSSVDSLASVQVGFDQFIPAQVETKTETKTETQAKQSNSALVGFEERSDVQLAFTRLLRQFIAVCQAIAFAHEKGVLHRDLKPDNVMLGEFGETLVVDWGLAKVFKRDVAPDSDQESGHSEQRTATNMNKSTGIEISEPRKATTQGIVHGTPSYMSPEQVTGARVEDVTLDELTDVYSLGAILYFLLTNQDPVTGDNSTEILEKVFAGEIRTPRAIDSSIPAPLEAICLTAMQREKSDRYAKAIDLAADVEAWLADEPVSVFPDSWSEKRRRWKKRHPRWVAGFTVGTVMGIFALVGGAVLSVLHANDVADKNVALQIAKDEVETKNIELEDANKEATDANIKLTEANMTVAAQNIELTNANREVKAKKEEVEAKNKVVEAQKKVVEETNDALVISVKNEREAKQLAVELAKQEETARLQAQQKERTALRLLYVADMNLAQTAWNNARVGEILRLLKLHKPDGPLAGGPDDFRGFEWHFWNRLAHFYQRNLTDHTGAVWCVALSADGKRLASASYDQTIRVWDAQTGLSLLTLNGHTDRVVSVAFSPDGKWLASASHDTTVRVWDIKNGQVILTFPGHTREVTSVAFSPDGKWLASGSEDRTARVWDATTGQELLTLEGHKERVSSVAFSPDGKRLASASWDHTLKVWDAASGQEQLTLTGHKNLVASVAFSPDGNQIASASFDDTVRLWDATSGQEKLKLEGHTDDVQSVAFRADGKWLASASEDQTVKVWDVKSGQELLTLKGHTDTIRSVVFLADGTRLVSASDDRTLKFWDAVNGQKTLAWEAHIVGATSVAFSPDGKRLASASEDFSVKVWDAENVQSAFETDPLKLDPLKLNQHTKAVNCVVFSPDGKWLASASHDKTVKMWDSMTGLATRTLNEHTSPVICVAFSPDGKWLASASEDRTVKVWDTATGLVTLTLQGHTDKVTSVAWSADGMLLASGSEDQTVKIWDAQTGLEMRTLKGHILNVRGVAFSPDGKWLASGSWDKTVKLWDVATGQEKLTMKGHTDLVMSVAFSPDSKRLASASWDKTVKLWDIASGQEMLTLKGHTSFVMGAVFSQDGQRLASIGLDKNVMVWDARP
ncbi:MAG: protein kinase domain-containing protein [Planctomycetaceae bacterium]